MNLHNKLQVTANYFKKSIFAVLIAVGLFLVVISFSLVVNNNSNKNNPQSNNIIDTFNITPLPSATTLIPAINGSVPLNYQTIEDNYVAYAIPEGYVEPPSATRSSGYDTYHKKLFEKTTEDNRKIWIEVKTTPNTKNLTFNEFFIAEYPRIIVTKTETGRLKNYPGIIITYTDPNNVLLGNTQFIYYPNSYYSVSAYSEITPESDLIAMQKELSSIRQSIVQTIDLNKLIITSDPYDILTQNERYFRDNKL